MNPGQVDLMERSRLEVVQNTVAKEAQVLLQGRWAVESDVAEITRIENTSSRRVGR